MNIDKMLNADLYDKGIYGIYVKNKLVYVGMTMDSFNRRFRSHRRHINEVMNGRYNGGNRHLYVALARYVIDGKNIEFRPLICLSKLNIQEESVRCNPQLTRRDVECMELAFISYFKPILNIQGIYTEYPLDRN